MLASVDEEASLHLTWSETPEDTFSPDEAHIILCKFRRKEKFTSAELSLTIVTLQLKMTSVPQRISYGICESLPLLPSKYLSGI